jgi:hypothetical protein
MEEVLGHRRLHAENVIVIGIVAGDFHFYVTGVNDDAPVGGDRVSFGAAALRAEQREERRGQKGRDADARRPEEWSAKAGGYSVLN